MSPFQGLSTGLGPVTRPFLDPSPHSPGRFRPITRPGAVTCPRCRHLAVSGPVYWPGTCHPGAIKPSGLVTQPLSPSHSWSRHLSTGHLNVWDPSLGRSQTRYLYGGHSSKQFPSANCSWTRRLSGGCYGDREPSTGPPSAVLRPVMYPGFVL